MYSGEFDYVGWGDRSEDYISHMTEVSRYGGFWISRYELSKESNEYSHSFSGANIGNTQSMRGKFTGYSYAGNVNPRGIGWISWWSESFVEDWGISSNAYSTAIWDGAYWMLLKWLQENGINIRTSNPTDVTGDSRSGEHGREYDTGTNENDKLCNIYDLLGLLNCWTLGVYGERFGIERESTYSYKYPAFFDHSVITSESNYNGGRIMLIPKP